MTGSAAASPRHCYILVQHQLELRASWEYAEGRGVRARGFEYLAGSAAAISSLCHGCSQKRFAVSRAEFKGDDDADARWTAVGFTFPPLFAGGARVVK